MRLDFRILWIDDQQKHVNSFAEGLEYKLVELGFELEVIRIESLEKAREIAAGHVHSDGIDLVMVDFDLGTGSGDGGAEALQAVRQSFPYKEVIFYSAQDAKALRKIAYEAGVDGIIFSTRLTLVNDTIQVIENLLRRVMDVDHMRGVVMSAASDIDFLVEHSLIALYDRLDESGKNNFCESISLDLRAKLKDWEADLDRASRKKSFPPLLKLRHIFSSMDRISSLNGCLAPMGSSTSPYQGKIIEYSKNIVPRRNKLAHVILKKENGSSELKGAEQFSLEELAILRKELIDHRKNFNTVAVLLDVKF